MPAIDATVSLVAPGAMGAALAARLHAYGIGVLTSLRGRGPASAERARQSGMRAVADDAELLQARLFLSVVPPDQALALARRFIALIRAGHAGPIPVYVDLNATNPDSARAIGAEIADAGGAFIDGCIIGPPPGADSTGPSIHLAGTAAAGTSAWLRAAGLDARDMAAPVGAASALKMAYAGINKGLTALGACMLLAAERHGAREALLAELGHSRPDLLRRLGPALPDMLPKAYRWAPEMSEIANFIGTERPESGIYRAMEAFFAHLATLEPETPEYDLLARGIP
ncbi:MAG: DUF1932 domain-containing protein [Pseudomonas sp.]